MEVLGLNMGTCLCLGCVRFCDDYKFCFGAGNIRL